MATTSRPITELVIGIRDTAGAVVASGKARFYEPGTLVARDVFSDDVCTSAITQPLTLNAGGQYKYAYALEPVRMIVKDSTETTTYYDGIVNLNRHDAVYITHTSINSGTETTFENFLTTATGSLGADFKYKPTATATAMNYSDWMTGVVVSVKSFGAVGDGSNDDTIPIQNASNHVESLGGGVVYFPAGTYRITSAITVDTAGVSWKGAGRGVSIIKNGSTTGNCLTINLGAAVDSKIFIRDMSFTANTTSSGAAIQVTNGDRVVVHNVSTALHRSGVDLDAVSGARVDHVIIESTDDNAAALGISVGARGRVTHCEIISGTDNGTGVSLAGADARAIDCYVSNFATGISLAGTAARASQCLVSSATTGYSVGAFSSCSVTECSTVSCTTDLSVNASATLFVFEHNAFSDSKVSASSASIFSGIPTWGQYHPTANNSSSVTWTPDPSDGKVLQIFENNYSAGAVTASVAATSTTGLRDGQMMLIHFENDASGNPVNVTFDGQYTHVGGTAFAAPTAVSAGATWSVLFRWKASASAWRAALVTAVNTAV